MENMLAPTPSTTSPASTRRCCGIVGVFRKIGTLLNVTLPFRAARNNWTLVRLMAERNIQSRYKGSVIGLVWTFIQPLVLLCVYSFVFGVVFHSRWAGLAGGRKGAFVIVMFFGMTLYSIFSEAVATCCVEITGHPNFVKKVVFPLEILPLARVLSSFVLNLPWFLLLLLGTVFLLGSANWTMLLLPLVLLPLLQMTLGISFLTASLGVYLRDTQHFVQIILRILWFMTPIFYPAEAIPVRYRWVMTVNPLTLIVEQGRKIFLFGQNPDWIPLICAIAVSSLILQLGFIWFCRTKEGFADVL